MQTLDHLKNFKLMQKLCSDTRPRGNNDEEEEQRLDQAFNQFGQADLFHTTSINQPNSIVSNSELPSLNKLTFARKNEDHSNRKNKPTKSEDNLVKNWLQQKKRLNMIEERFNQVIEERDNS